MALATQDRATSATPSTDSTTDSPFKDHLDKVHGKGWSDGYLAGLDDRRLIEEMRRHEALQSETAASAQRIDDFFGEGAAVEGKQVPYQSGFDLSRHLEETKGEETPSEITERSIPSPASPTNTTPSPSADPATRPIDQEREILEAESKKIDVGEARILETLEQVIRDGRFEKFKESFYRAHDCTPAEWVSDETKCRGLNKEEREIAVALAQGDPDRARAIEAAHVLLRENDRFSHWFVKVWAVNQAIENLTDVQKGKLDDWLKEKGHTGTDHLLDKILHDDEMGYVRDLLRRNETERWAIALGQGSPERILELLEKIPSDRIDAVRKKFNPDGGDTLDQFIDKKLDGVERDRARALLLKADPDGKEVTKLFDLLQKIYQKPSQTGGKDIYSNPRADEAARLTPEIKNLIESLGAKRAAVEALYDKTFSQSLAKTLGVFGPETKRELVAILHDDKATLTVIKIKNSLAGSKAEWDARICAALDDVASHDEARALIRSYSDIYGRALIDILQKEALNNSFNKLDRWLREKPVTTPTPHVPVTAPTDITAALATQTLSGPPNSRPEIGNALEALNDLNLPALERTLAGGDGTHLSGEWVREALRLVDLFQSPELDLESARADYRKKYRRELDEDLTLLMKLIG